MQSETMITLSAITILGIGVLFGLGAFLKRVRDEKMAQLVKDLKDYELSSSVSTSSKPDIRKMRRYNDSIISEH
jgi:hypothetical protein